MRLPEHLTLGETTERRQGEGMSLLGAFERFHLPRPGIVQNSIPTQATRNGDQS